MHRFTETSTAETAAGTMQERLPEMIDQALGRLHEIGVERLLKLAEAMVEQRMNQPADAHLTSTAGRN